MDPHLYFKIFIYMMIAIYTMALIAASWDYRYPPKKINMDRGYRTGLSMKNMDNWNYANKTAPIVMIKVLLLGFSIFIPLAFYLKEKISNERLLYLILVAYTLSNVFSIFIIMDRKLNKFVKMKSKK
jgi:uncharacterized membrane protein